MLIDTHTHLYDDETQAAQDEHIRASVAAGVHKLFMPNCDLETMAPMLAIEARFPKVCFSMLGLHPCYVKEDYEAVLNTMEAALPTHKFAGIGEVGLDFHWDKTFVKEQKIAFERQVDWALSARLPVIIHSRSATQECVDIIARKQNGNLRALFHCFGGTKEQALRISDMGCFIGIGGVLTFKNSTLPEVVRAVPRNAVVLETDAPYLAPVPYRGKRNRSEYLVLIAQKLADIWEMPLAEAAEITTANAEKIFS